MIAETLAWWRGGETLMPVMFLVAVVLYTILVERSLVLWGASQRVWPRCGGWCRSRD